MFVISACATQPGISSKNIDALVNDAMQEFSVPGVAVGVIKDGVVVHAAGYGVRELGLMDPVDLQTMFRIASTTKAITTASLAILVDAGKLSWDDKVVDYIPEFALYDPWVTKEFTVADLLTHRSGLEGGAGDLMLWPKPNKFTRADLINGLSYFKPESAFRTEYAYDNLLYIVAGELVPAVRDRYVVVGFCRAEYFQQAWHQSLLCRAYSRATNAEPRCATRNHRGRTAYR